MGAGQNDLGPLGDLLDVHDEGPDPVAALVGLAVDLLGGGDDRLGAAEVHDDAAPLEALDEPADDLAFLVLVLVVDLVSLGVLDLLDDDLLGRLDGDPAEAGRVDLHAQAVARLGFLVEIPFRLLDGDLRLGVKHLLHDRLELEDFQLARLFVVLGLELHLRPQLLFRRGEDGRLKGLDDDFLLDPLVLAHLFDETFQLRKHA